MPRRGILQKDQRPTNIIDELEKVSVPVQIESNIDDGPRDDAAKTTVTPPKSTMRSTIAWRRDMTRIEPPIILNNII
ncbi:hypothetical protein HanHA300_Chr16g0607271 [Helianthus annuus]|nr:hypothetical protein HanHA300_Chr16g0607271 [Helianthus annuus]KAJ0460197.1 hypothetical protein HanHA89_Chr16g0657871 [Helianthus annuus]KAJ0640636.1 hypothetical protein HanLR1_Chr16g0617851 [Helianthus annuus]KAJ0644560.1 hypothetical protein HanOQP8_Chr16g0613601 [Helianthus annuus]